jgi:hypothetical protein
MSDEINRHIEATLEMSRKAEALMSTVVGAIGWENTVLMLQRISNKRDANAAFLKAATEFVKGAQP